MPIWIFCTLTIFGDIEELLVFQKKIPDNLIFELLRPTPEELDDILARLDSGEEPTPKEKLNLEKFGVNNWNCFDYLNKWSDEDTKLLYHDNNHLRFETRFVWNLPRAAIEAISMNFPNLRFTIEDLSTDYGGYYRKISWENGEVISDHLIGKNDEPDIWIQFSGKQKWVCRFYQITSCLKYLWSSILLKMGIEDELADDLPF